VRSSAKGTPKLTTPAESRSGTGDAIARDKIAAASSAFIRRSMPTTVRVAIAGTLCLALALRLSIATGNLTALDRLLVPDDAYYTLTVALACHDFQFRHPHCCDRHPRRNHRLYSLTRLTLPTIRRISRSGYNPSWRGRGIAT
jgi:hypothetical protein